MRRALASCLPVILGLGAVLGFGVLQLRSGIEGIAAQAADPTVVVQQFFDAINRRGAAAAAALFSDAPTYTGPACPNTCTDKPAIETAIATNWVPFAPHEFAVVQVCGQTVATVDQNTGGGARPGSDRYVVTDFEVSNGQISVYRRPTPDILLLGDARALAAQACVAEPAAPAPFNRGGVLSIDPRLTVWLGATLLGVVTAVLIALLLHVGRRLRTRA